MFGQSEPWLPILLVASHREERQGLGVEFSGSKEGSALKQVHAELHSLRLQEHGAPCSLYVLGLQVNCKILFIENSSRLPQMFIEPMLFARHAGERG